MSTIKTKNIKQTVISETVQPLKIGGILEDGSDAKISIDTSGNVTASNLTATFSGLLTSNGQIKFPATQNASADANTLDDYEEGTWTPVVFGSSSYGVGTYTTQIGKYTKIGNTVHLHLRCAWSAHTGSGGIRISGLPFVNALSFEISGTGSGVTGYPVVGYRYFGISYNGVIAFADIHSTTTGGFVGNSTIISSGEVTAEFTYITN